LRLHRFCRNVSLMLVLALLAWIFLPGLARAGTGKALAWTVKNPKLIIDMAMPAWGPDVPDPLGTARTALSMVCGVDFSGPQEIVLSQLPLDTDEDKVIYVNLSKGGDTATGSEQASGTGAQRTVGIYNTHTGETFPLDDGVERMDGKRGGVVDVTERLEQCLRQQGINTVRSAKIHDASYPQSYLESLKTAREMLDGHPEIDILLDVHRDSKRDRKDSVVSIDGRNAATILLVVGSDARQPFPNWRENYAFAQEVAEKAEELYPGLVYGVRVKEGRYNQFLHPHAILVEIGGVSNHRTEAEYAAELFAHVLAAVLSEMDD